MGLGEEMVGAVLAALLAAALMAGATSVVGEVADLIGAPPGQEPTATTALEHGAAPDGDALMLTPERIQKNTH
ncbi:hypothetical protein [Streptomyces neyagawaensis]|uniref:hypothetical protein n=1 Tax=Streptomyces neyagawaensis TaxID=42238 RepID=UPI0014701562|nr:hypothetical protein [Streptomyces neyagawaensis]MCL6732566.1 hypothetical protein [Streptomyces neyagawaensis]MDE1687205.1 hypothetical protein [Streptomyces neyagawaensis]